MFSGRDLVLHPSDLSWGWSGLPQPEVSAGHIRRATGLGDWQKGPGWANMQKQFFGNLNIIMLQLPCLKPGNMTDCRMYYEYLLYLLPETDVL